MGEVVQLKRVGAERANVEREWVEAFAAYANSRWHPATRLKRGCARAVARVAYRHSDGGKDWLKVCPADLLVAALPNEWDERTVDLSTNMTMLFWDFLLSRGAIRSADVAFLEGWTHGGQACLYRLLLERHADTPER